MGIAIDISLLREFIYMFCVFEYEIKLFLCILILLIHWSNGGDQGFEFVDTSCDFLSLEAQVIDCFHQHSGH